jgi:hypothetical protein
MAARKKLHRSFAAKNAAQDDSSSLVEKVSGREFRLAARGARAVASQAV